MHTHVNTHTTHTHTHTHTQVRKTTREKTEATWEKRMQLLKHQLEATQALVLTPFLAHPPPSLPPPPPRTHQFTYHAYPSLPAHAPTHLSCIPTNYLTYHAYPQTNLPIMHTRHRHISHKRTGRQSVERTPRDKDDAVARSDYHRKTSGRARRGKLRVYRCAVLSTDADAGLEGLSVLLYAYVRDCTRAYLHAR